LTISSFSLAANYSKNPKAERIGLSVAGFAILIE